MTLLEEIDYLILRQFSQSKKLKGLICAAVKPFQEALTNLEEIERRRFIDDAYGYSLDIIGHIVDFGRNGMNDQDYRAWLKIAILLNCSQGRARDLFNILQVLYAGTPPIEIEEKGYSLIHFDFSSFTHDNLEAIKSIMKRAVPIGVRCTFGGVLPPSPTTTSPAKLSTSSHTLQKPPSIFRFDTTGLDNSIFADFL